MFRVLFLTACLAVGLASPVLAAPCVEGSAEAKAIELRDAAGPPLVAALSLWTSLLVKQDLPGQLKRVAKGCERGDVQAGDKAYALRGDSNEGIVARVAATTSKKGPVGYLTPVPDLVAAMTAGHTGPPPILGFALVILDGDVHTTWRLYDAIPADAVLRTDFAAALAGQGKPLMRWRGGKIEIIV